jgi:hypothetical protein
MTIDYRTFYSYIRNHNTNLTNLFLQSLGEPIMNKLPDRICSSKVIYDILRQDLDTYYKQRLFRNTFMEYFKWKVLYAQ